MRSVSIAGLYRGRAASFNRAGATHPAGQDADEFVAGFNLVGRVSAAATVLCWLHIQNVRYSGWHSAAGTPLNLKQLLLILLIYQSWMAAFRIESWNTRSLDSRFRFFLGLSATVLLAWTLCNVVLCFSFYLLDAPGLRHFSMANFAIQSAAVGCLCVLTSILFSLVAVTSSKPQRSIILGSRRRAVAVYKDLVANHHRRVRVLGFLDSDSSHSRYLPCDYLGSTQSLEQVLSTYAINAVYIALPLRSHHQEVQEAIWTCERAGVACIRMAEVFELSPRVHQSAQQVASVSPRSDTYTVVSTSRSA